MKTPLSLLAIVCCFFYTCKKKVYQTGEASYYADFFHGKKTASGEIFNMHAMTAAHRKLPFRTTIKVCNLANDKCVKVRINDRGPRKDIKAKDGTPRILDLSLGAAQKLEMLSLIHI